MLESGLEFWALRRTFSAPTTLAPFSLAALSTRARASTAGCECALLQPGRARSRGTRRSDSQSLRRLLLRHTAPLHRDSRRASARSCEPNQRIEARDIRAAFHSSTAGLHKSILQTN